MGQETGYHRRENASFISKLFFWWVLPVIQLANKRELEISDFDVTSSSDKAEILKLRLGTRWKQELQRSNPSLHRAFLIVFSKELIMTTFGFAFLLIGLRLGTPVLLGYLIKTLSWKIHSTNTFALLAVLYIFLTFANTLITHPLSNYTLHVSVKARIAISALIYNKSLRLSQVGLTKTSVGQITNLLSNDLNRFDRGMDTVFYAIVGPFQVAVAVAILWQYVGVSILPAFFSMIAFTAYQIFGFSKSVSKLRMSIAKRTDSRIRLLSQVITGLSLVKMFLMEKLYVDAIDEARKHELTQIHKRIRIQAYVNSLMDVFPKFNVLLIFLTFVLMGNSLSTETAFVVLNMLGALSQTIGLRMPFGASILGELVTTTTRIQNFLLLEEQKNSANTEYTPSVKSEQILKVEADNLSFRWNTTPVFSDINFLANSGELVVIVGQVGSGKSTLLQVLLSELTPDTGQVKLYGSKAYASQDPWLLPAETIRDNIIFGFPYDCNWYETVIDACALRVDLESFPYGDMTLVGSKGANLSGGQKARINLARACYSNAEIYLLDDPISAVDANVANHIIQKCIKGILKDKCVILVTHHIQFLQHADKIITLGPTIEDSNTETSVEEMTIDELYEPKAPKETVSISTSTAITHSNAYGTFPTAVKELQSVGRIKFSLVMEYLRAGNSCISLLFSVLLLTAYQSFLTGSDIWLKVWTAAETYQITNTSTGVHLENTSSLDRVDSVVVYGILIAVALVLSIARSVKLFKDFLDSSIAIHSKLIRAIVRVPMRFIEVNTPGGILNRFAYDTGMMDELVPFRINVVLASMLLIMGSSVVVCLSSPIMLIPTVLIYASSVFMIKIYSRGAATIKRLEGICRSPVLTILGTTISGIGTIRAYQRQDLCIKKFETALDTHTSAFLTSLYASRWLQMTVELLGDIYTLVVIGALVIIPTSPSTFGLIANSLSTAVSTIFSFTYQFTEALTLFTSIERVLEFTNVKPEAPLTIPNRKPHNWPDTGNLRTDNLCVRYENGPMVLQDITINLYPKEKVGIIGRTGSGKSTLVAALFRIVEKSSGFIHIDSVDISKIGLHDLRGKISIIPQTPFLFSGTVRKVLDPFSHHLDSKIWEALESVQLSERLESDGLESKVEDGGLNFSQGERQLLGLARSLLQKNKFLVLDEATSSIDAQMDSIIQEVIRNRYKDCTVLTIAHRLNTVMDSDRILVLDSGRIVEFSDPVSLLENPQSYLSRLVQRSGPANAQKMYKKAKEYITQKTVPVLNE